MLQPLVTILVPNYKTPELTKLCLRLLRKYTTPEQAHVLVVDNESNDESTEYLRSLSWVELIERKNIPGDPGPVSHGLALDMALEKVTTPYVMSIHTDTLFKRKDCLDFLLSYIQDKPNVAGVGSWKLESKPWMKRILKSLEFHWQKFWYTLTGEKDHYLRGFGKNYYYLRGHCALYRMEYIRKYGLTFAEDRLSPGQVMHKKLVDHGHEMIFLPSEILSKYVDHINHATVVLNPQMGSRKKTIVQGQRRIEKALSQVGAKEVLADSSLDE